jgi:predicted transcriptional regulator
MEIAAYLGRDPTAVSQYARKIEGARELIAAADKALGVQGK